MHCPHCGTRVTVRAEACASCRRVFPADFWTNAGNEMTEIQDATTRRQIGLVLDGHYRVDQFIARGGMGEVFLGTDTKLKRQVAIKFLAAQDTPDKLMSQRFIREAQAAACLDHPNIITVHAVGEHEGRPFIVMKYVQGQAVTDLIRAQGRLPLAQAVHIIQQVCDGLAQIHARGFVHRDIKPHNLMVETDGRCLILDFGILRDVGSELTTSGVMTGTPAYLAPEQAKDSKRADARSDLYSLGITFFEMITGQLPFRADSALDMVLKHYVEPPPPATALVPDLPPEVDTVLFRVLAKNPDERFQSAVELRQAVGTLAAPEPWRPGLSPLPPALEGTWGFESRWQGPGGSLGAVSAGTGPGATSIHGESVNPARPTSIRRSRAPIVAVALLLVAGAAVGSWLATREPGSEPTRRAASGTPASADAGVVRTALPAPAQEHPPSAASGGHPKGAAPAPPDSVAAGADPGKAAPTAPAPIAKAPKPRRSRRRRASTSAAASALELAWLKSAAKQASVNRSTGRPPSSTPPRPRTPSPRMAVLSVDSTPRGAMVWAAAKRLGETPIDGTLLKPGTYTITVEKKGHASWVRSVRLRRGSTERLRAILTPKAGQLHVVTLYQKRGTWSGISIDGSKPVMTHSLKRAVKAGRHWIRVRRPGYREIRREVRVGPGASRRIELTLEKE